MKGFIEVTFIDKSGFTEYALIHYTQLYYKNYYWWFKQYKLKQSNEEIKRLIKRAS